MQRKLEQIRHVIWDCDWTLWDHCDNEIEQILKSEAIPLTISLERQFQTMIQEYDKRFSRRMLTEQKIIQLIGETMPELYCFGLSSVEFFQAWKNTNTTMVNEGAEKVLRLLQSAGKENIVVSDWLQQTQIRLLKKYGLLDYIEKVYGCNNSYLKKNPKLVPNIIKPGEEQYYVIIGDSLENDIAFANHAEIPSIWYNPKRCANNTKYVPTFEITSLLQVLDIIM